MHSVNALLIAILFSPDGLFGQMAAVCTLLARCKRERNANYNIYLLIYCQSTREMPIARNCMFNFRCNFVRNRAPTRGFCFLAVAANFKSGIQRYRVITRRRFSVANAFLLPLKRRKNTKASTMPVKYRSARTHHFYFVA